MGSKQEVSLAQQLAHLAVVREVEVPTRQRVLRHLARVDLQRLHLVPEGVSQQLLQFKLDHEAREASLLLLEPGEEVSDAGVVDGLVDCSLAVVVGEGELGAVSEQGMDGLVVVADHRQHQRRVPKLVPPVDIRSSQCQHLDQREVVAQSSDLQRIIPVLLIDRLIDREAAVQQLHDLVHLVPGDGPEHAIGVGVREDDWVLAVPGDGIVEVGDVVEEEGIGGVARVAREPLVEVEGQPLRRAEDRVRVLEVNCRALQIQHLYYSQTE